MSDDPIRQTTDDILEAYLRSGAEFARLHAALRQIEALTLSQGATLNDACVIARKAILQCPGK